MTKQERHAFQPYSAEDDYNAAQEKLRRLKEVEAERCLEDWKEIEKKRSLRRCRILRCSLGERNRERTTRAMQNSETFPLGVEMFNVKQKTFF